jgi:hypothetical protein
MAIKKLIHITVICKGIYEEKGAAGVYAYMNKYMKEHPNPNTKYKYCTGCEGQTPHFGDDCLVCGGTFLTETDMDF